MRGKRCILHAQFYCVSYPRCYECRYYQEPTYADRIRGMTDEELAKFISAVSLCGEGFGCEGCFLNNSSGNCRTDGGILHRLKQPYKENEK